VSRPLAAALALFAALLAIASVRYAPPPVRDASTPPAEFSAVRARRIQETIASGEPRLVGSEANARARAFLARELAASGWKVEDQRALSCGPHGTCAYVTNVVGVREGSDPAAAPVLLMAHHDSVACSPGASDDGVGTSAVVEVARALASAPSLRRSIVVVLTDGEEAGLLGARAFVARHPLAQRIRGAVNVDSRGGAGPSAMFETSAGNGWQIAELGRRLSRPVTSSMFYEVYRRMPNDTDFTVVRPFARGVNFANISRIESYHTPLDSLAHADPRTLQHHGEQALAMIRALADAGAELEAPLDARADAVWFDVLALCVVRWPVSWSLPLALLALALVLAQTARLRAWGLGLGAGFTAFVAALATSIAVGGLLARAGALPVPWVAHRAYALFALHGATAAAALAAASTLVRRSPAESRWAGTWLLWAVLGVVAAAVAPGASYLFVVPSLAAGLAAFAPRRLRELASVAPSVLAASLLVPVALLTYDALGFAIPAVTCIATTLLATTLVPLLRPVPRAAPLTLVALAIAAAIAALAVPKFSGDVPQRVNVVLRQEGEKSTVTVEPSWGPMAWGEAPRAMVDALAAGGPVTTSAATPWSRPGPTVTVPVGALLPTPAVTVTHAGDAGGRREVRAHLAATRRGGTVVLDLGRTRSVDVRVNGEPATLREGALAIRGVPEDGVDVDLSAEGAAPIDVAVIAVTHGFPAGAEVAQRVADARRSGAQPAEAAAVPTQEGDVTLAVIRASW